MISLWIWINLPLRNIEDIKNCVELLIKKRHQMLLLGRPLDAPDTIEEYPGDRVGLSKTTKTPITCRQDSPSVTAEAAIYVWSRGYFE